MYLTQLHSLSGLSIFFLDVTGERTLDDILHHHRLPCEVGFPKERTIVMGERTINTTHLPNMTLTGTFDELHFLGFSVCDGMTQNDTRSVQRSNE